MEEKKFEELLIAIKGKDKAEIQGKEAIQILRELLNAEFAGIGERKWKVMLKQPEGGGKASVNVVDGTVFLWINPDVQKESLRAVLRHELLHCLLRMADDADPRFKAMARARKIDVWNV